MEQTAEKEAGRSVALSRDELEQLLAETAKGSPEALANLYTAARAAVYAIALSYLKEPYGAQDVMQETFVRIWQRAGQYRPGGSPMAWILTLARNLSLMQLRKSGREAGLSSEEWHALAEPAPNVTEEDRLLLENALSTLDDAERRVVLLHASSGLKHREIAALLGLPLSTVLSKYQRALKKMRIIMEGTDTA